MQPPLEIPFLFGIDLQPWMFFGVGALLVLLGRRLYWLFFACMGFFLASLPLQYLIEVQKSHLAWQCLPLLAGMLGGFLVVVIQKKVLRFAGLFSGAYLGFLIADTYLLQPWPWVAMIVSGAMAFWLILPLFNASLILFSSCLGGHLILLQADLAKETKLAGWGLITLVGIWVQTKRHQSADRRKKKKGRDRVNDED